VAGTANAQQLDINAAGGGDLGFILGTKLRDGFGFQIAAGM
jgi:hypothetical protein